MQDQLTDHLDQQLKSTSLENFSDYLKNLQQLPSLQDFFSVYIAKHDMKISQIIKNSGISQSYAHEILMVRNLILPEIIYLLCVLGHIWI